MKKYIHIAYIFIFLSLAFIDTAYSATVVYSNDFESGSPGLTGWTWEDNTNPNYYLTVVEAPNLTDNFLGRHVVNNEGFTTDQVALTLSGLAPHSYVTVAFDLYIINHWEGNGNYDNGNGGPDLWRFGIDDGLIPFVTFSTKSSYSQSYPDEHTGYGPGANNNPSGTGSVSLRNGTLDYLYDFTYEMEITLPHTAPSLTLFFEGDLVDNNGFWGLDNVIVETSAVPIPGAALLFGSSMLGIIGIRRKLKK